MGRKVRRPWGFRTGIGKTAHRSAARSGGDIFRLLVEEQKQDEECRQGNADCVVCPSPSKSRCLDPGDCRTYEVAEHDGDDIKPVCRAALVNKEEICNLVAATLISTAMMMHERLRLSLGASVQSSPILPHSLNQPGQIADW